VHPPKQAGPLIIIVAGSKPSPSPSEAGMTSRAGENGDSYACDEGVRNEVSSEVRSEATSRMLLGIGL